ncbi:MAG: hypothetical protein AAF371_17780 [Pseudomonadota bacterium]
MRVLQGSGVAYDAAYFDAETLRALFDGRLRPCAGLSGAAHVPADARAIFREVWQDLAECPGLGGARASGGGVSEALFAETMRRRWQAGAVAAESFPAVEHRIRPAPCGGVTHLIGDAAVIEIPPASDPDGAVSDRIAFIIAAARLVVDALTLVAASSGVRVAAMAEARDEAMRFVVQQYGGAIMVNAGRFGALAATAGSAEERLRRVVRLLRDAMTPMWIVERLLQGIGQAERRQTAADVLFDIALMSIPRDGKAAALRLPSLGGMEGVLLADLDAVDAAWGACDGRRLATSA